MITRIEIESTLVYAMNASCPHRNINRIFAVQEITTARNFKSTIEINLNSDEQELLQQLCDKIESRISLQVKE